MMTKTLWKKIFGTLALLFVILLPLAAFAVDTSVLEGEQAMPQGFTTLHFNKNSKAITADFVTPEGQRVFIETRRGARTPLSVRRNDPEAPAYQIDIRLLDKYGMPFFVQVGGDDPIDSQWTSLFEAASGKDPETKSMKARENFHAAKNMLDSIKDQRFKTKFRPEQEALKMWHH
jgi:hypothetical protein